MAQSSAPVVNQNLSDANWRDLFGDEPGVVGDLDGSAYAVSLPTDSDVAQIGSVTQPSLARLAGFSHRIPAGQPEGITIPAASGTARTDLIALRYDPAVHTGAPGPVRLVRIPGTSSGLPAYDAAPPGVEDLPLQAITRQPGQALSQATVRQLYPRIGVMLSVPVGAPLPTSSPLGTRARQGADEYERTLDSNGIAVWRAINVRQDTGWQPLQLHVGWTPSYAQYRVRDGWFHFTVAAGRGSWQDGEALFLIPGGSANFPKRRWVTVGADVGRVRELAAEPGGWARLVGGGGTSGVTVSGSWPLGE